MNVEGVWELFVEERWHACSYISEISASFEPSNSIQANLASDLLVERKETTFTTRHFTVFMYLRNSKEEIFQRF